MHKALLYKYVCGCFLLLFYFFRPIIFPQSQHHDDEKRVLSREIIVLNNHLMEAKLTIEKLQDDNVSGLDEHFELFPDLLH